MKELETTVFRGRKYTIDYHLGGDPLHGVWRVAGVYPY